MSVVIGAATVAVLLRTAAATAAGTADLAVKQAISGSTSTGKAVDTIKVSNVGPDTATNVIVLLYMKSATTGYSVVGSAGTCVVSPAPPGYTGTVLSCLLGSLASAGTINEVATVSGAAGVAFKATATVSASETDPALTNNLSTVSSWFGPRADLALTETAATGASAGQATVTTTVLNRGPNTASDLQLISQIQTTGSVSVTVTGAGSCQTIPPGVGYQFAYSCVLNSLANATRWVDKFSYVGTAGAPLHVDTTVKEVSPPDPVSGNNAAGASTTFHP